MQARSKPALLLPTQISVPTSDLQTKESVTPQNQVLAVNGYSPRRQAALRGQSILINSPNDDPYSILPKEYRLQLENKQRAINVND
jgi:hypothetical protein